MPVAYEPLCEHNGVCILANGFLQTLKRHPRSLPVRRHLYEYMHLIFMSTCSAARTLIHLQVKLYLQPRRQVTSIIVHPKLLLLHALVPLSAFFLSRLSASRNLIFYPPTSTRKSHPKSSDPSSLNTKSPRNPTITSHHFSSPIRRHSGRVDLASRPFHNLSRFVGCTSIVLVVMEVVVTDVLPVTVTGLGNEGGISADLVKLPGVKCGRGGLTVTFLPS